MTPINTDTIVCYFIIVLGGFIVLLSVIKIYCYVTLYSVTEWRDGFIVTTIEKIFPSASFFF